MMQVIHRHDASKILEDIQAELDRSKVLHQEKFNSIMELRGVLGEELDEVFDEIKLAKDNVPDPERLADLHAELLQLAAMCVKGIEGFCIIKRENMQ